MNKNLFENAMVYLQSLLQGLDSTHDANSRPLFSQHIEEASRLIVLLYHNRPDQELKQQIEKQRRLIGHSYLPDEKPDRLFHAIATQIEKM